VAPSVDSTMERSGRFGHAPREAPSGRRTRAGRPPLWLTVPPRPLRVKRQAAYCDQTTRRCRSIMVETELQPRGGRSGTDRTQVSVLNPMGYPPRVTPKDMAPRLDTLEGKKVFLVDCRFDDAELFLKQMLAWFQEHMPGVQAELIRLSSVY